MSSDQSFSEGLEGVVAAQSSICLVDGQAGRLIYQGYDVSDLARWSGFEETAFLLWHGRLPTQSEYDDLLAQMISYRPLPERVLHMLKQVPKEANQMDILRSGVSLLGLFDPDANSNTPEANYRKAVRLTSQLATLVAANHRIRHGLEPIQPLTSGTLASNFLYMVTGDRPRSGIAKVFDVALILHADHELNASTFAARVTAATLSDMHSAITSAVGTLKGPLHGGANEAVMRMLIQIDKPEAVEAFVQGEFAAKRKIPGFGHRVYRTWDPRALVLRDLMCELEASAGDSKWCTLARLVAESVWQKKQLYPNVDFYSAPLYYTIGIPIELFTPIFAVSRISGWSAHVLEQFSNNRLIRPRAEYTGKMNVEYVPIQDRTAAPATA